MKRLTTLLVLTLLATAASAQSITTIELQNRPAAEIIPIVKPMLAGEDAITGEGFTIFLRSSPETLARVREIIDALDVPARILRLSVFQGDQRDLRQLSANARISVESGDASAGIGNEREDGDAGGGSITYSTANGSASIDGISTSRRLRENPIHQVRVAEGVEAHIETGEQIPYFSGAAWIGAGGVAAGVEYKDAVTGFYVLPRIRGDNVILEVNPFKAARSKTGDIDTQAASTTITGRIGEWLLIGGVTEQQERAQRSPGTSVATRSGAESGIWIRADLGVEPN